MWIIKFSFRFLRRATVGALHTIQLNSYYSMLNHKFSMVNYCFDFLFRWFHFKSKYINYLPSMISNKLTGTKWMQMFPALWTAGVNISPNRNIVHDRVSQLKNAILLYLCKVRQKCSRHFCMLSCKSVW